MQAKRTTLVGNHLGEPLVHLSRAREFPIARERKQLAKRSRFRLLHIHLQTRHFMDFLTILTHLFGSRLENDDRAVRRILTTTHSGIQRAPGHDRCICVPAEQSSPNRSDTIDLVLRRSVLAWTADGSFGTQLFDRLRNIADQLAAVPVDQFNRIHIDG